MVIRRTRALVATLLAFALLPIVSMTVTGTTDTGIRAATAWMQSSAKAQSAVQGTSDVRDMAAHHPDASPFTAAEAFQYRLSAPSAATAPATPRAIAAGAPLSLHPARAPPALL